MRTFVVSSILEDAKSTEGYVEDLASQPGEVLEAEDADGEEDQEKRQNAEDDDDDPQSVDILLLNH